MEYQGTVKMLFKILNTIIETIMALLVIGIPIMLGIAIGWMIWLKL